MKPLSSGPLLAMTAGISLGIAVAAAAGGPQSRWSGPEHIWRSSCGYCHGGAAGAPELRGAGLPPEAIVQFARQGGAGMPSFHRSEISDVELRQLAEWIVAQPDPRERR